MALGPEVLTSWVGTLGKIILYGWPLMFAMWMVFLYTRWRRWPIEAVIFEKRGSNIIKTNDRAGKYVDGLAGITGYKLQKSKDTIPIIDFDWILHNVAIPTTFFERFVNLIRGNAGTIVLFRYGSKQYKPVNINENPEGKLELEEVKDKQGQPVFFFNYIPVDPRDKLGALEFEVVDWDNMNFMVQEQRVSVERRRRQKDWMYTIGIPVIMIAGAALVCLLMLKFSYDYSIAVRGSGSSQPQNPSPDIPVVGDIIPGA